MRRVFQQRGPQLALLGASHAELPERPLVVLDPTDSATILEAYYPGRLAHRDALGAVVGQEVIWLLGPAQTPAHLPDFEPAGQAQEVHVDFAA